jgi:hypothetical protein
MKATTADRRAAGERAGAVPSARLGGVPGEVLRLQRAAGNRAVGLAIGRAGAAAPAHRGPTVAPAPAVVVQRCGPVACDCSAAERAEHAADEPGGPAVQRAVGQDFEVRGKSPDANSEPDSLFFDRNTIVPDSTELSKIDAFAPETLSTITLIGYASEEETDRATLVNQRLNGVKALLKAVAPGTGDPVLVPDLDATDGQLDYRGARKVEILVGGAPSDQPDCALGSDVACGPSPNPFDNGFDAATNVLLPAAIAALDKPRQSPAKEALGLFGGACNASKVKAALLGVQAHFPNMVPAIPRGDGTAGGHRCINSCEGEDVLANNKGLGPAARMTLGPRYLRSGSAITQGLVLIHEGSHGATGVDADDLAYKWQRLLTRLPPRDALTNADSLTRFVELIHNPAAPSPVPADDASALPAGKRDAALAALAWLEQWLVQGRLDIRSLYAAVNRAVSAGAWDPGDRGYRDHVMNHVAARFALTAPPAVPSADDEATVAGIFDRLYKLRLAITEGGKRTFQPGPAPSVWDLGPGPTITVAPDFLALDERGKVEALLDMAVQAAPYILATHEAAYAGLVKDLSPGFGGP